MTFEATPPGQEPISTIPAATSGLFVKIMASPLPTKGITENCRAIPMRTARGIVKTRRKSAMVNCVPIPNMMIWIRGTIRPFNSYPNQLRNARG